MAREASLQVPSAKPVVCRETSPSEEMVIIIRCMELGPQFDGELDGAISKLGLGDRVPLPTRLQLGRLSSVGLQEAGQFLWVAPETLKMIMQDGPVGSDADRKSPVGQLHPGTRGDLVKQADLAMCGRGQTEAQASGGEGRLAFDLCLDRNCVRHDKAPSVARWKRKSPELIGPEAWEGDRPMGIGVVI